MIKRIFIAMTILLVSATGTKAQGFVDLKSNELKIDTVLPYYTYIHDIGMSYSDSTYKVVLEYPEFKEMTKAEIKKYKELSGNKKLPEMPEIDTYLSVDRKIGQLNVSFMPLVYRDKKYLKLTSFKMVISGIAKEPSVGSRAKTAGNTERYAANSVLESGKWYKIRVAHSGFYQITAEEAKAAGFDDLSKVKVYGYGGAVQPEVLTGEYLQQTDDLKEITTYSNGNRKVFYAQGPVSWDSASSVERKLNNYSLYGYYFLTEGDTPLTEELNNFTARNYPSSNDYHSLHEIDDFSWMEGGRNLVESSCVAATGSNYTLSAPSGCKNGSLFISLTADKAEKVAVELNNVALGNINLSNRGEYDFATIASKTFSVSNIDSINTITLKCSNNGNVRLDYISLTYDKPFPMPDVQNGLLPSPEYVSQVANQNLHNDSNYQMVIIVPESGINTAQAERIAEAHRQRDSLTVKVVSAQMLYNEFSSGTPDANAYRRYLKMMYDRAGTDETKMPKYLLLFGDAAWDNRMVLPTWQKDSPADYLLCYESENSRSDVACYVMEDYFALLDDGEGGKHSSADKPDVGVGRLTATSSREAEIMTDKIVDYIENNNAGDWQNKICVIGDDGNENMHMEQAENVAQRILASNPNIDLRRYYTDAYERKTSSVGFSYPDAAKEIKQQWIDGTLFFNYTGHGSAIQLSHEKVLVQSDFDTNQTSHLPLWFTAACITMPFDTKTENLGEVAVRNPKGGAVAFVGTSRTVFANYNEQINLYFSENVVKVQNGKRNSIGDALRMAKNQLVNSRRDLSENKLHYILLGDPAMQLALPRPRMVIDSINGVPLNSKSETEPFVLPAGANVKVSGHVLAADMQTTDTLYNGIVSATVKDAEQLIVCNDWDRSGEPFQYLDNNIIVYKGSNKITKGCFDINFAVPLDIIYSDDSNGQMLFYGVNEDKRQTVNTKFEDFQLNTSLDIENDSIGPSIYCYLNNPKFMNGDEVNPTPYFYAEVKDEDGINASGSSIGHDMLLVIDGDMFKTYNLNNQFIYDFGTYKSGYLSFSIPELVPGPHTLMFRAWDILNNSSSVELKFNVVRGLESKIYNIYAQQNPARYYTQFVLQHDRPNTPIDIIFEVFDMQGRMVWHNEDRNVYSDGVYYLKWDLCSNSHQTVGTGVYLYRAKIKSEGSCETVKAQKLIILRQ